MTGNLSRRDFLGTSTASLGGLAAASAGLACAGPVTKPTGEFRLGLVTYLLARDWDVDTIIKNCSETGFEAVELRTTHGHGVEVTLNPSERAEVRKKFEDSSVRLASLGSAFEYHQLDPAEVKQHIEGTKEYAILAKDVGADGIKVRPNGLQLKAGIPADDTLRQIGRALHEVGESSRDHGIQIRVECHGRDTNRIPNMKKIMDYADCDNVYVCWNSNPVDLEDGGLEANYALLEDKIAFLHMRDLFLESYPFRRLFELLAASGYKGYCCAEIPASTDPIRVMKYYRGMFLALQNKL